MISFCACIKNRADNLKRLIASLEEMDAIIPFELIVADFQSTDATLKSWEQPTFPLRVVTMSSPYFNRSQGLNRAASLARGDKLFFIDVDMLVPRLFLHMLDANVQDGQCWFPICYSLHKDKPAEVKDSSRHASKANGWWRTEGAGMCGFMKKDFEAIGRWDEKIGETYGKEDNEICRRAADKLTRIRERCPGLFHVWHPTTRDYRERYHKRKTKMLLRPKPKVQRAPVKNAGKPARKLVIKPITKRKRK